MSIRKGNRIIAGVGGEADNTTIGLNQYAKLSAIALTNDNENNNAIKMWTGTLAEYNNLPEYSEDTIYNITDDEVIRDNTSNFNLFDTKLTDHILQGDEALGWALQGTYVYKTAIAGSRPGYPDFYNRVVNEFNEATSTETINGIEVKVHSNGHKFYDITNKEAIDNFFSTMGTAWFYGVDTENERIFLPRNNYFDQATSDVSEVGKSVEAGLPNITGQFHDYGIENGSASGAFAYNHLYGDRYGHTDKNFINQGGFDFNASRSSAIYGKSSTVQPNAVKKLLYICVGNTTNYEGMTEVVNQGMEILEQVNEGIATRADGQWTQKIQMLSQATAIGNYAIDLSDYLPKDGYDYEVQFECSMSQTNSALVSTCWIGTFNTGISGDQNVSNSYIEIVMAQGGWSVGHCTLKIDSNKVVYCYVGNNVSNECNFKAVSYRRLGTNR